MPEFKVYIDDPDSWEPLIQYAKKHKAIKIKASASQRTNQQNRALHKGINNITQKCLELGITKQAFFEKITRVEVPIDEEDIKTVFRVISKELFGEHSTTAITSDKLDKVWELAAMAFAKRLGIDIGDLPSMESMRIKSILKQEI